MLLSAIYYLRVFLPMDARLPPGDTLLLRNSPYRQHDNKRNSYDIYAKLLSYRLGCRRLA